MAAVWEGVGALPSLLPYSKHRAGTTGSCHRTTCPLQGPTGRCIAASTTERRTLAHNTHTHTHALNAWRNSRERLLSRLS